MSLKVSTKILQTRWCSFHSTRCWNLIHVVGWALEWVERGTANSSCRHPPTGLITLLPRMKEMELVSYVLVTSVHPYDEPNITSSHGDGAFQVNKLINTKWQSTNINEAAISMTHDTTHRFYQFQIGLWHDSRQTVYIWHYKSPQSCHPKQSSNLNAYGNGG